MRDEPGSAVEWVSEFRRRHGRDPRVLHIGNIANNAYNNAKLLNRHGFDCDVLCADYYHIMGCPEWEDADFEGAVVGSEFDPNWRAMDLKGYQRPPWFAQGPLTTCMRYLEARRRGHRLAAALWWRLMRREETAKGRAIVSSLIGLARDTALYGIGLTFGLAIALGVGGRHLGVALAALSGALLLRRLVGAMATALRLARGVVPAAAPTGPPVDSSFDSRANALVAEFVARFPDRFDALTASDLECFRQDLPQWRRLLTHYDLVQAYAIEGILPLLAGRPYVAFEHGTIREIPFEATPRGRWAALAYSMADAVYMTNADSLPMALRLRAGERDRIVCGVHGVDLPRLQARIAASALLPRAASRFGVEDSVSLFFAPARQDHAIKGNDRAIRGAALLRQRRSDARFVLALASWGADIEASRRLVHELGLDDAVRWIHPLNKRALLAAYRCVDAILDQFVVPCVGGVTIEALAVGVAPVLTSLDDAALAEFYGETIPLFNCVTPEQVAAALEVVITDPAAARARVEACTAWMETRHSTRVQLDTNLRAYDLALTKS